MAADCIGHDFRGIIAAAISAKLRVAVIHASFTSVRGSVPQ